MTAAVDRALRETAMVIPSYNGRRLLERFLPSIDLPLAQVVVVDQGNADGTESYCQGTGANVLQIGQQSTFTHACNAGIQWAIDRGFQYILVANNDLQFATPVVHQLLATALEQPRAGVIAPTQAMIVDGQLEWIAYLSGWDLGRLLFRHRTTPLESADRDIDADFCEFTCVLLSTAVLQEVGLLDDDFGFYHEDAELGLRLWLNRYRAIYNQEAQILHWGSSTVSSALGRKRKESLIHRNQRRIVEKYLARGVNLILDSDVAVGTSAAALYFRGLEDIFGRYGVQRAGGLPLGFGKAIGPSTRVGGIGYDDAHATLDQTDFQTLDLVVAPSQAAAERLKAAGHANVAVLRLGVDPQVFRPTAGPLPIGTERKYLVSADASDVASLQRVLDVWRAIRSQVPHGQLVLVGRAPLQDLPNLGTPDSRLIRGSIRHEWYGAERTWVLDPTRPLAPTELAQVYSASHAYLCLSDMAESQLRTMEALACGCVCIVPQTDAYAEVLASQAGFGVPLLQSTGSGWRLSEDALKAAWMAASHLTEDAKRKAVQEGRDLVHTRFALRWAALDMYRALESLPAAGSEWQGRGERGIRSWADVETRYIRGSAAEALIRLGGMLQRAGAMLRTRGLGAAVARARRFLTGSIER